MRTASNFVTYVTEQLRCLGQVSTRPIFGGEGICVDGRLVGVIVQDALYLYTDENNRGQYLARGMGPFRAYPNAVNLTTDQYEVPTDIVQDPQQLQAWARDALSASIASAKAKQMAGLQRVWHAKREAQKQRKKKRDKAADEGPDDEGQQ